MTYTHDCFLWWTSQYTSLFSTSKCLLWYTLIHNLYLWSNLKLILQNYFKFILILEYVCLKLGLVYTIDQLPWPLLSEIFHWLRNEWHSHCISHKVASIRSDHGWTCQKVAWNLTCLEMDNVWCSPGFCSERSPIGCPNGK